MSLGFILRVKGSPQKPGSGLNWSVSKSPLWLLYGDWMVGGANTDLGGVLGSDTQVRDEVDRLGAVALEMHGWGGRPQQLSLSLGISISNKPLWDVHSVSSV